MAKGRTKNKRARKPELVYSPLKWPPVRPTAYFTTTDGRDGFVDAELRGFYNPLEPVYHFIVFVHPGPGQSLEFKQGSGWLGLPSDAHRTTITQSIEKAFTPMWYRFEPILI